MSKIVDDLISSHNEEVDHKTLSYVLELFQSGDDISIPLIQRKCKVGYNSAYRVLKELIKDKKVKEGDTQFSVCKFI